MRQIVLMIEIYLCLHEFSLTFFSILTKLELSCNISIKFLNIKFHGEPSSENLADTCVQMNRRTDGQMDGRLEDNTSPPPKN
jgi:hypothetical protein